MRKHGLTLVETVIIIVFLAMMLVWWDASHHRHGMPRRTMCASNLRQIGLGLVNYAQDNGDRFPAVPASASSTFVGTDVNLESSANDGQSPWRNLVPGQPDDPFAKDAKGNDLAPTNTVTMSASLWLLIRHNLSTPKVFICPEVKGKHSVEDPSLDANTPASPKFLSDFYTDPDAGALMSYSFASPYSPQWTTRAKPDTVIGADANNGPNPVYNPAGESGSTMTDLAGVDGADWSQANSTNHKSEGQNYLAVDASVIWAKTPYVGIQGDNIYTALPEKFEGEARTVLGVLRVRPWGKTESVLIPVDESVLKNWDRKTGASEAKGTKTSN